MLTIQHLYKRFGDLTVLDNFSLHMDEGEVVAVIGPSGTGKSTLLRCINYLERPLSGSITIDGLTLDAAHASKKDILHLRRKTSMVFQNYNLFANKTALQNIMEPLISAQKMKKDEAKARALDILRLISLADKANNYPSQLSGGQQQRIGIGRAMSTSPRLILFDEPTSSLDPELVGEVLDVIRTLAAQKTTMLITTHEMDFARSIADKIVFMDQGHIVEEGNADDIFLNARQARTREFLRHYYTRSAAD